MTEPQRSRNCTEEIETLDEADLREERRDRHRHQPDADHLRRIVELQLQRVDEIEGAKLHDDRLRETDDDADDDPGQRALVVPLERGVPLLLFRHALRGPRAFGQIEPDQAGADIAERRDREEGCDDVDFREGRRDARPDRRADAEGRAERGDARRPLAPRRAVGDIGLRRRAVARAEAAEDRARQHQQREDDRQRQPAPQADEHEAGEDRRRDRKGAEAQQHDRLAPDDVAAPSPERARHDPQKRRQRIDHRRLELAHAEAPRDGRQHRIDERLPHAAGKLAEKQYLEGAFSLGGRRRRAAERRGFRFGFFFGSCWHGPLPAFSSDSWPRCTGKRRDRQRETLRFRAVRPRLLTHGRPGLVSPERKSGRLPWTCR